MKWKTLIPCLKSTLPELLAQSYNLQQCIDESHSQLYGFETLRILYTRTSPIYIKTIYRSKTLLTESNHEENVRIYLLRCEQHVECWGIYFARFQVVHKHYRAQM